MTDHELERLVQRFADCVMAQARAIYVGHVSKNDEFGDGYVAAVEQLFAMGDKGRAALSRLFRHEEAQVRVAAAAWLLRSHYNEARALLEAEGKHAGIVGFQAQQALLRWDSGEWQLDPSDT